VQKSTRKDLRLHKVGDDFQPSAEIKKRKHPSVQNKGGDDFQPRAEINKEAPQFAQQQGWR
jgi:hypothetical protein